MLHIILMILKILGILILSILGLGLCIGLLVLFCPIRYYLEGSIYGKPNGHMRISWLFRLICMTLSYQEDRFAWKLCIFGIRLRKPKKKNLLFGSRKKIQKRREKKEKKQIEEKTNEKEQVIEEKINKKEQIIEEKNSQKTEDKENKEEKISQIKEKKVESIPIKIKGILNKVKNIFTKIREILFAIKTGIPKVITMLRSVHKKKQMVLAFIKEEKNKEAFRYAKGNLFQLLCHVLPGKVTIKLHYGFSDPAITGILTGMIFMFYPKSAEKFQLMPDFEKQVLEGELTIKGRVRLIKVLWLLFSIYFHKECNRIIKMMLKTLTKREL